MRISGPEARALASRLFHAKESLRERVATYGEIRDEEGVPIDRGLAIISFGPRSYTGEDSLELQMHGSPAIVREVLRAVLRCGARYAGPGEFTRRAFLNGKMDLHAAGAVADLIEAETRSAARAALANLGGGLAGAVREARARLSAALEELSASIDFPDEVDEPDSRRLRGELQLLREELLALARAGEAGRLVREGVSVAIVGPPNAGKSSLLNALLREERAIVSDLPGTTRDTIEESIVVEGMTVRLIDTAGIRAHGGQIERAGMARTAAALESARVALVVLDGSRVLAPEGWTLLAQTRARPRVVFCNKADLGDAGSREIDDPDAVRGSTRDPASIATLRGAIARIGWGGELPDLERPHLASQREMDAVNEAIRALERAVGTLERREPSDFIVRDLQTAFAELGHLTGDAAGEALLDGVFARFCIGK